MRRIVALLIVGFVGSMITFARGTDEAASLSSAGDDRSVTHELGETLVAGTPARVIALEYSFVDALASVGIAPVGIADDNDRARIIPQIAKEIGDSWVSVGTRRQPNLEVILSLAPDLIIADFQRHSGIYEELSAIAPTIVLKSLESSYRENLDSMRTIGHALGRAEEVEKRLEAHAETMDELTARIPSGESRRFLSAVVWDEGFNAHTSSAYTGDVLASLGLASAIIADEPYARLNLESLVATDPDVLFLMVTGERTLIDEWRGSSLWEGLTSVKNSSVFTMDRNLWSRFRGIIAAEEIARDVIESLY